MYHYNFTNDLRISNLDSTLKDAAHAFLTDTVPSPTVDKSKNNNFMTVGFYFNLKAKGICAKLAESGNIKKVVLNFIKKFQFPNVRTPSDYENTISDGIKLAPMREIVKFLNALSLIDKNEAYLTKEEIQYFIFFNESIAKKENPNILEAISQLINYRKTKQLPQNINTNENEHFWNQPERQIREMIKTLKYTGCFLDVDENTIKLDVKNISRDSKADLFEIINFDSYWTGKTVEDWQKYMDEGLEIENNEINIIKSSPSTQPPKQAIFYGVPGSGKSYKIDEITKNLSEEQKIRVVFHPEYTNADFVGQILPCLTSDGIEYRFKAGPFSRILKKAYQNPDKPHYLIIEEINRGNAAAIFGDLFQLLDRDSEGWSSYKIENLDINSFIRSKDSTYSDAKIESSVNVGGYTWTENTGIRLPPNLSLLATMNTSDQNVFTLDNAFQRRWDMELVPNSCDDKTQMDASISIKGKTITWKSFQSKINEVIAEKGNESGFSSMEDKRLGCWFIKNNEEGIDPEKFANKVLKYLWDDAFKFNRSEIFIDEVKNFEELKNLFVGDKGFEIFKDINFDFEPQNIEENQES